MASDRLGLQPRKACQNPAIQFVKDLNLSAFTAGFVAELVGFTSSVAIVFQAAQAFGATPAQITSWRWPLGLGKRLMPRYAVVLTLLGAMVYVAACGQLDWTTVTFSFAMPVFVAPHFTVAAVSLAVPLFVVTMASQNLPGVAAIRAAGYGLDAPDGGEDESHREAALITSLVTLSCVVIAGVGSAFWGVAAGGAALFVQQYGQQRRMPVSGSASTTQAAGPLRNP